MGNWSGADIRRPGAVQNDIPGRFFVVPIIELPMTRSSASRTSFVVGSYGFLRLFAGIVLRD